LTNEHAVVKSAQQQAAQIERQAQTNAASQKHGADEYTTQMLKDLHARLEQFAQQIAQMQAQVYNGLNVMQQEQTPSDAPPNREQNS
jgi:F0F1-type ATP synthase membrane subunit b/b'